MCVCARWEWDAQGIMDGLRKGAKEHVCVYLGVWSLSKEP